MKRAIVPLQRQTELGAPPARARLSTERRAATADTTSLVLYDPRTADPEEVALAGFPAGYAGRTREAYALGLRQYLAWCSARQLRLFDAHRTDIELTLATSKSTTGPGPPSAVACRPSPASTATRQRRA